MKMPIGEQEISLQLIARAETLLAEAKANSEGARATLTICLMEDMLALMHEQHRVIMEDLTREPIRRA